MLHQRWEALLFDAYTNDWLHLLARWFHIITGAAWIGTSFYFIWLNNSIRPPESPEDEGDNVKGVGWSIHGGAFYRTTKYDGAPVHLPKTLHWFKWEAYLTWISGIALLALIYWTQAQSFMVDPQVADLSASEAVMTGIGVLVGGWFAYDILCKTLAKTPMLLAVIGLALLTGLAIFLTNTLSPRAAYIHVGAVMGTIMAANVFVVIIPNQRVMVDAMLAGEKPDVSKGADGALRSLHNNYLTLPVLFIMVSNHFPFTFGSSASWAVLVTISILGAAIRHWFNLHGQGHKNGYLLPGAALGMLALALAMKPAAPDKNVEPVSWCEVQPIIERHCVSCHAENPTDPGWAMAPQGLMLDTPERVMARKHDVYARSAVLKTMPLGNKTEMTERERKLIADWYNTSGELADCSTPTPPNDAGAGGQGSEAQPTEESKGTDEGASASPTASAAAGKPTDTEATKTPTAAPPTPPMPKVEKRVAQPPVKKVVIPRPDGERPSSCGSIKQGLVPVDCTKNGDKNAYCVLDRYCVCSADDGFLCEKARDPERPGWCEPGSSCVTSN